MMAKYSIEYEAQFKRRSERYHSSGDDPVACEEFLEELLERGYHVKTIRHDGMDVTQAEFDRMLKTAASMLAAKSIRNSLGISPEEEHYRFGFSA